MPGLAALIPSLMLLATALAIALAGARRGRDSAPSVAPGAGVAAIGVFFSVLACIRLWGHRLEAFGMLEVDGFSLFLSLLVLAGLALTLPVARAALGREKQERPEFYALLLLSATGMLLMVSTRNLILLFVALETLSLGVYALSGWARERADSVEASLKYFLYGAFASAFLLYGIALFYGLAGSVDLAEIESALLARRGDLGLLPVAALSLLVVGFGYKVAAAPFHMWAPDVYQGAPTVVTAFMAVTVKASAFGALLRATGWLGSLGEEWRGLLWVLAALSMTVGNLVAIAQEDVKRMLAYSSVAHVGYLLLGVLAGGEAGRTASLYYLGAYTFMNFGAFAVAIALGKAGEENLALRNWGGLGWKYPLPGVAMAVFMLSLTGLPPTAGFFGKFYVFSAAIQEGFVGLVLLGVINTLVSAYYYLRVVMVLFLGQPSPDPALPPAGLALRVPLVISAAATLLLGLLPAPWLEVARRAALEFF
jgi:NADH-quinone oxidoreductase subunit N